MTGRETKLKEKPGKKKIEEREKEEEDFRGQLPSHTVRRRKKEKIYRNRES